MILTQIYLGISYGLKSVFLSRIYPSPVSDKQACTFEADFSEDSKDMSRGTGRFDQNMSE